MQTLTILTYHRVVSDFMISDASGMSVTLFEQQLRWLKRFFSPLLLPVALQRLQEGTLPPRAIVVTVDDGYADSYTHILPLLQKFGIPASFYITTGGIEQGYLWEERVAQSIFQSPPDRKSLFFDTEEYSLGTYADRQTAVSQIREIIKYQPVAQRKRSIQALIEECGEPRMDRWFLSAEQIRELHQSGMHIGAHTVNHPILTLEADETARLEITQSKSDLEAILQADVDSFAYPNGRVGDDFDLHHCKMVERAGFDSALTTDPGVNGNDCQPFLIKRITPWQKSAVRFLIGMAAASWAGRKL